MVNVDLLRRQVSQLRVLILHRDALLATITFIKEVGLEKALELHDDIGKVNSLKALSQDHAEKSYRRLVKRYIIAGVVLDYTSELNEALYV